MPQFLIDANLPYYFSLWNHPDYVHQKDIDDEWEDDQIWAYAKKNNLTIISKDSDFSNRILLREPPPKIIHLRFGSLKMKDFFAVITSCWQSVIELNDTYKLVNQGKRMTIFYLVSFYDKAYFLNLSASYKSQNEYSIEISLKTERFRLDAFALGVNVFRDRIEGIN